MKRDMDIIRKVLLAIEEQYNDVVLYDLEIDGLDMKTIAYHCNLLYEAGFIDDFEGNYAENEIYTFGVGSLTWDGHEFLDKIRNDTVWEKTKETMSKKGLPIVIDVIKDITSSLIGEMTKTAIKSLI